jgi:hypothetical protein
MQTEHISERLADWMKCLSSHVTRSFEKKLHLVSSLLEVLLSPLVIY